MGCKANQYDSAAIEGMLAQAGWTLVDYNSLADAYIINTCTVTNKADSEAKQLIRRAHRSNPEASIIVTGCSAQTDPQSLAAVEGVSFVVGNRQKNSILDYLNQTRPLVPEIIVEDIFQEEAIFTSDFTSYSKHTRAFLKIQDGCNQMCSYCVIPFARGKNRSLAPSEVLRKLKDLSEQGFCEVVLTGIHIGTYGRDLDSPCTLLDLMRLIEEEQPVHRVRLSSIDPEEVSSEMVDFLSTSKVFCNYLHIPLQSGEDTILKLMRRRYLAADFEELVEQLKEKIAGVCLGTDVMVGFPYEDEMRFEKSYQFLEKLPLDYLHVFPYSSKKKTRAASFMGQVSNSVKRERVKRLTELSREKKEKFYRSSLGSVAEVIIEHEIEATLSPSPQPSPVQGEGVWKGMSRNYIPVYLPIPSQGDLKGKLVSTQIDRYEGGYVFGKVIEE
jgi:threonylcarbamoyladenosine tRNA methylthiotransferase MtaB